MGGIDDAMKWVSLSAYGTGGETEARETMRLVQGHTENEQQTCQRGPGGVTSEPKLLLHFTSTRDRLVAGGPVEGAGWWGRREKSGAGQDKASESRDKASG